MGNTNPLSMNDCLFRGTNCANACTYMQAQVNDWKNPLFHDWCIDGAEQACFAEMMAPKVCEKGAALMEEDFELEGARMMEGRTPSLRRDAEVANEACKGLR